MFFFFYIKTHVPFSLVPWGGWATSEGEAHFIGKEQRFNCYKTGSLIFLQITSTVNNTGRAEAEAGPCSHHSTPFTTSCSFPKHLQSCNHTSISELWTRWECDVCPRGERLPDLWCYEHNRGRGVATADVPNTKLSFKITRGSWNLNTHSSETSP